MSNLDSINITLNSSLLFLGAGLVILIAYTYYIYKYTIPAVRPAFKYFLVLLRSVTIGTIFLLIFEPIINLNYIEEVEPITAVFIDNSRSISYEDSLSRTEEIFSLIEELESSTVKSKFFTLSREITPMDIDSLEFLNFTDPATDITTAINYVKNSNLNIASIILMSDGISTEGSSPVYVAEKLNIPVFTIGIGDSSVRADVEVKNILFNEFIYANQITLIEAAVLNKGFEGKRVTVELLEDNVLISENVIELNAGGINKTRFEYQPKSPGEKKISIRVSQLENDVSDANNSSTFFIKVLENKLKVLVIAGSPSSDLSFIINSLKSNDYYSVETIAQISFNRYAETNTNISLIDSADVIFLIGFPSTESSPALLRSVETAINNDKPFFIALAPGINYAKLEILKTFLPFNFSGSSFGSIEVQPYVIIGGSTIFSSISQNQIAEWNNLPPVNQPRLEITAKAESRVLIKSAFKGIVADIPLLLSRSAGKKRSIAFLAQDIWKWKLRPGNHDAALFDDLIFNIVKWLNTDSEIKPVIIKPAKRFYNVGEAIQFQAQVYDELFNPVNDAEIMVSIKSSANNFEVVMNATGGGLYEGILETSIPGDYSFNGTAVKNNETIGTDAGKLTIGNVEVEKISLRMNKAMLQLLAEVTGGKYYDISEQEKFIEYLNSLDAGQISVRKETAELNLWSSEYLLILLIVLFSLEWFFRKRTGML